MEIVNLTIIKLNLSKAYVSEVSEEGDSKEIGMLRHNKQYSEKENLNALRSIP